MEDFRDPQTAQRWSTDPTAHNPTRGEQLDILLAVLESRYAHGETILDIGMGSGIVERMIFERIPQARVMGVDGSPAMLELARETLAPYEGQYDVAVHDITEIASLSLPASEYEVVISAQTIHNVPDKAKREVFEFVYSVLKRQGLFLLLDRIAVETPGLFDVYRTQWKRLAGGQGERIEGREGTTYEEHRRTLADRGDQPIGLEEHLQWLREIGFEVACIHLHGNRALFAARKP